MTEERNDEPSDALADLLSIVSHDVKNGLNVINLGAHQLAAMKNVEPDAAARLKRVSEMLTRASKRMSDLMRDIVDLARIESGSLALDLRPFKVRDAASAAIDLHRRDAEERKVAIDLSIAADVHAIGDAERIGNVVAVFLSNAIRVSPEGARIDVAASISDARVRVTVKDTG